MRLERSILRRTALVAVAGALCVPAVAGANVQVGASGWQWGNPLPQGNTINAMAFAGTTGYAVGSFGTLLKSADGGATWTGLPTGTRDPLSIVQAVDANTIVAGGGCVARRSTDGGQTFTRIPFTPVESSCPNGSMLAALSFLSADAGFIVTADGSVYSTADGGGTFSSKTALPGTGTTGGPAKPTVISMRTPTEGYAATTGGDIFQTLDAGNSWKPVFDGSAPVNDLLFVSAGTGYAVGNGSTFLKTTDGGATWKSLKPGSVGDLKSITCASTQSCIATTTAGTQLVRTTDGGDDFTTPSPSTNKIFAAAFASETRVVAAGAGGTTVVSGDGGATFAPVGGQLGGSFTNIFAGAQPGTAYAVGQNAALAITADGGVSWRRANVLTSQAIDSVSFPDANNGYALDTAGGLFYTANGGQAWKTLDTGSTARGNDVIAPDAATVIVVGPTGLRRSTDSGNTFMTVRAKPVARAKLYAADRAGSAIFVYGYRDLVRSTDKGRTWKAIAKPRTGPKGRQKIATVYDADFVSANTGFILDSARRVWRTANGGRSWAQLDAVGTSQISEIAFSSSKKGYLVVDGAAVPPLRTDDGGATWHPQIVTGNDSFKIAAGAGADYLLAGNNSLLFTTTGGDRGTASTLAIKAPKRVYKKVPKGTITINGTLKPASGNEQVTVSYLAPGATYWREVTARVSSNGRFTTSWRLRKGVNKFVAQWSGDFRSAGHGTKALSVKVG